MTTQQFLGRFIVIVGPGGAGKDTLMRQAFIDLEQMDVRHVHPLVTATTRPPRPGEVDGVAYHFKSHDEFDRMIENGELIEYQQVTSGNYYGIPRSSVDEIVQRGEHVMGDIDIYGAKHVLEHYDNVALIYISVGTPQMTHEERLEILRARMESRGDSQAGIEERLERARTLELDFADLCNIIIYNNNLQQATHDLVQAIIAVTQQQQIKEQPHE